jgi:sialic acid synthase SpsE
MTEEYTLREVARETRPSGRPYVIAETACAHDGDPDTLRTLLREIEPAEPDAIQVEILSPDHQVTPAHDVYELIDDLAFSWEVWEEILLELIDMEPEVVVFAYDRPSIEFATQYDIDGIKLSSADLSNPEMIELAADAAVPTTLSTGGCGLDEIARTVDEYTAVAETNPILMHGIQNFPTSLSDAWINRIRVLYDLFDLPVGYQDHTDGSTAFAKYVDLLALGAGVNVLEKHVALSRSDTETDFEAALEPDEFADYIETVRSGGDALGSRQLKPSSASEREYQKFQKKRIVTTEPIRQGERITREKVEFLRTGSTDGLVPRRFNEIVRQTASRNLLKFEALEPNDVEQG